VIVWQMCRQVWARWMDTAVIAGALDLPDYDQRRRGYLACGWLPPKWDWVDPMKDARAEIEQIEAGLKSRTQALAERGYDAEQVDAEIVAEGTGEIARSDFWIGLGRCGGAGRNHSYGSGHEGLGKPANPMWSSLSAFGIQLIAPFPLVAALTVRATSPRPCSLLGRYTPRIVCAGLQSACRR
jgi:hypothetical protein